MSGARSAGRQALDLAELEEERDRYRAEVERLTVLLARPEPVVVPLPWGSPPMSLNDRRHWRAHDRERRAVREAARWAIRAARLGQHERVEAGLHWRPVDNRRRDDDNPVATAKVVFDALVDEGVVPDDVPMHMRKLMPQIHAAEKGQPGAVWLTVVVLD